jgi:hypothetical protein
VSGDRIWLVAIAGESNLTGRGIVSIEMADQFALAEVPESAADDLIKVLCGTTIKGQEGDRTPGRRTDTVFAGWLRSLSASMAG